MGRLSPIESEFDSTEDAETYERWFRANVERGLADPRPSVAGDSLMAELDAIIAEAERRGRRPAPGSG
jgi:Stability determinant